MSLKSWIVPHVAERRLSASSLLAARRKAERARSRAKEPHRVELFHDPADPYSQLIHSLIPRLRQNYGITVQVHEIGPPAASANPEAALLAAYARKDAQILANKAGLAFTPVMRPHATETADADARLRALGHYQGGMIHYAGEWYWGLDRLHYLEDRLVELGANRQAGPPTPIFSPPCVPTGTGASGAELHWYVSFRSPYSAIVRDRVKALADAYGATLRLRYVLPMVMRGLPVPPAKRRYIPLDTAREARRLGVPFGRLMDPVGKPVEMAYALLPWAREQGRDYEFARSWLSGVWAEGVDAGNTRNLLRLVERAGLDGAEARGHLGSGDWQAEAEANRAEMISLGIWGVPSFRVGQTVVWGQDRLWVVEDALKALSKANSFL